MLEVWSVASIQSTPQKEPKVLATTEDPQERTIPIITFLNHMVVDDHVIL